MLRQLARTFLAAALIFSIGLHWVVLQSAAWAGMLMSFAVQGTMIEAVEKTFDGAHPCPLCQTVREAQQKVPDDATPPPAKFMKKLDALFTIAHRLIPPPARLWSHAELVLNAEVRTVRPSTPPPRA
jgi:hypothetical protein